MSHSVARGLKPAAATVVEGPSDDRGTARPVRVLQWPRWMSTNYLPRVVDGLRDEGLRVTTPYLLGAGSTRLRSGDWLHVHWSTEAHVHHLRWLYMTRAESFHQHIRRLKRRGIRIAWTAHNLVPHDDPHPELGRCFRAELLAHTDHVFIHFPGAQDILRKEFGYTGPCTVVHHPAYVNVHPQPPSQAVARAGLGLPPRGFVALSFGKIRPYKGLADVIRAFQSIAGADDRLLVAGKPEGDVSAELDLAHRDPRIVVHAKRIPDDEVPTYFAAADVSVVAHHAFFTSGSALLSLSMGCPIVGQPINHLADLTGGQRLYPVGPGAEGLARGLVEARQQSPDVDRAALRAWAAAHGDWPDAAAQMAAVFRSP
ncbi:glycosyltransferase [Mycobacterium sp. AMU20-3851]|uniref:glycosyltransferase n=1 Tax=Mycobacterium sp. AMU20-3851 TaxID=3122055 RepID=UPI0037551D6E